LLCVTQVQLRLKQSIGQQLPLKVHQNSQMTRKSSKQKENGEKAFKTNEIRNTKLRPKSAQT